MLIVKILKNLILTFHYKLSPDDDLAQWIQRPGLVMLRQLLPSYFNCESGSDTHRLGFVAM